MKNEQIRTALEVIKLVKRGKSREDAFHLVANNKGVHYSTVSSQCVRELGMKSVYEFDIFLEKLRSLDFSEEFIQEMVEYKSVISN